MPDPTAATPPLRTSPRGEEAIATLPLLPAALAGDARARDQLVDLWGPVVLGWCARLGGEQVDEEDVAHDVMEHVLARLHTLRDPSAFAPWIYQATRRAIIDHRRRAWLRRWVPGRWVDPPDPREGAARAMERSELARQVHATLDALPTELREVLVLCEIEERDAREVAALVGIPLGTVKSRLRRAKARFAEEAPRQGLDPDLTMPSGGGA